MKNTLNKLYDFGFPVLAVVSIVLVIMDFTQNINISNQPYMIIDRAILIIFAVDYFTRLIRSKSKWEFFRSNIFDLLAIVPFSEAFSLFRFTRLLRLARLFRLVRLLGFVGSIKRRLSGVLHTNGLIYGIYAMLGLLCVGSVSIFYAEKGNSIKTIFDAAWWTIVTISTVGYGDISPQTPLGRIIAVCLMVFGIGFIGFFTSAITTYFMKNKHNSKAHQLHELTITMSDHQLELTMEYCQHLKNIEKGIYSNKKEA